MKKLALALVILIALAVAKGCNSAIITPKTMTTIRHRDATGSGNYSRVEKFSPGETPTVVIREYGGKTLTIRLYDLSSGEQVEYRDAYVPHGKDFWWSFPYLSVGSYKAVLEEDGLIRESCLFRVSD